VSINVLIYGAGEAGVQIASYCKESNSYNIVGFIDDNFDLQDKNVANIKVFPPEKIASLIKDFAVAEIFIAIPSVRRERYREILQRLSLHRVHLRTLPKQEEINEGRVNLEDVKEINIEDLLLRPPVEPIKDLLSRNVRNQIVLITGAGGSIGSELCRQIIKLGPKQIILLDHAEYNLYKISEELASITKKYNFYNLGVVPLLASVSDEEQITSLIEQYQPDTVFHAAAYKHVSLVENNTSAAVKNNILGTLYVAKASYESGVKNFTLISTDKAVRPCSVMGKTKRAAEMILQSFAAFDFTQRLQHNTLFSIVRFGNVLGSSGSVVPIFAEQIKQGGPVTVTHPEVTRFFMTISEAAQLVIQASSLAKGGELFLLDMGEPMKIYDLAKNMIELSGKSLMRSKSKKNKIEIIFTGLKPGEKLFEEMTTVGLPQGTIHQKILKVNEDYCSWSLYEPKLEKLKNRMNFIDSKDLNDLLVVNVEG
jgi:FlaA1/EpsC-like NDP-sugar epimerase